MQHKLGHFIEEEFPIFKKKRESGHHFVYLDTAATAQKPKVVIDAMTRFYLYENATVHRAIYQIAAEATDQYYSVRSKIKNFINAQSEDEIVFTSGTTDAMNLLAFSLGERLLPGDEIILSVAEHHANIVPWQMIAKKKNLHIKYVNITENGIIDLNHFQELLSDKVKIISVAIITNTIGAQNPIEKMIALARMFQAIVILDAAQAICHQRIDVQALDCDFLAFSSHKLYGPTGVGVLYGKYSILETLPPHKGGGDMIEKVSLKETSFQKPPLRFEAGTPMIAEVIGLGAAIDFIDAIGLDAIAAHEKSLVTYACEQLKKIPFLHILGASDLKTSLLTFYIKGLHHLDIGTILSLKGICVRTGLMCAEPFFQSLKLPGAIRISFGVYNTFEDIDYFIKMLKETIILLKPELSY